MCGNLYCKHLDGGLIICLFSCRHRKPEIPPRLQFRRHSQESLNHRGLPQCLPKVAVQLPPQKLRRSQEVHQFQIIPGQGPFVAIGRLYLPPVAILVHVLFERVPPVASHQHWQLEERGDGGQKGSRALELGV